MGKSMVDPWYVGVNGGLLVLGLLVLVAVPSSVLQPKIKIIPQFLVHIFNQIVDYPHIFLFILSILKIFLNDIIHWVVFLPFWASFLASILINPALDEGLCKIIPSNMNYASLPSTPSFFSKAFWTHVCNPLWIPRDISKVADICYVTTDSYVSSKLSSKGHLEHAEFLDPNQSNNTKVNDSISVPLVKKKSSFDTAKSSHIPDSLNLDTKNSYISTFIDSNPESSPSRSSPSKSASFNYSIRPCTQQIIKSTLLLDIYTPTIRPTSPSSPVILYIHNLIDWKNGCKEDSPFFAHYLASNKFVVVCPNYRIPNSKSVSNKSSLIDTLIDLKRSLNWINYNIAKYGGDASKIIVCGNEIGGLLSMLLTLQKNPIFQPDFENEVNLNKGIIGCVVINGLFDPLNSKRYIKYNVFQQFSDLCRVSLDNDKNVEIKDNQDKESKIDEVSSSLNLKNRKKKSKSKQSSNKKSTVESIDSQQISIYDGIDLKMLSPTLILQDILDKSVMSNSPDSKSPLDLSNSSSASVSSSSTSTLETNIPKIPPFFLIHRRTNSRRQPRQFSDLLRQLSVNLAYVELSGGFNYETGIRAHFIVNAIEKFANIVTIIASDPAKSLPTPPPSQKTGSTSKDKPPRST